MNPALEMMLEKARYHGLPKDVVERAILKGSGQLEGEEMKEVFYEGYGPNGSALLIKTVTSNTNRTSQSVRTALQKAGGSMAEIGAVSRQFKEQGLIVIDGKTEIIEDKGRQLEKITPFDPETLEMEIMELPIEDLHIEGQTAEVYSSKNDFIEVISLRIIRLALVEKIEKSVLISLKLSMMTKMWIRYIIISQNKPY